MLVLPVITASISQLRLFAGLACSPSLVLAAVCSQAAAVHKDKISFCRNRICQGVERQRFSSLGDLSVLARTSLTKGSVAAVVCHSHWREGQDRRVLVIVFPLLCLQQHSPPYPNIPPVRTRQPGLINCSRLCSFYFLLLSFVIRHKLLAIRTNNGNHFLGYYE